MATFFVMLGIFALNVLTPGASFVLTVSNAMTYGPRTGLFVALGLATADTMFAFAATAGLAGLLGQSILLAKGISLVGGLWFVYGGIQSMLRGREVALSKEGGSSAGVLSPPCAYRLGLAAGIFNIQAIIFFSSLFLAVLSTKPSLPEALALIIGVACISMLTRCNIVFVATVKSVARFYARRRRRMEVLSGTALAAFGLKLALPAAVTFAARLFAA